jgi:hypothetical protein
LSADGHIVDKQYGCGAHSDTPAPAGTGSPIYEPYDDGVLDVTQTPVEPPAAEQPEGAAEQPENVPEQPEGAAEQPEAVSEQPEEPAAAQPEAAAEEPVAEQPDATAEQPESSD